MNVGYTHRHVKGALRGPEGLTRYSRSILLSLSRTRSSAKDSHREDVFLSCVHQRGSRRWRKMTMAPGAPVPPPGPRLCYPAELPGGVLKCRSRVWADDTEFHEELMGLNIGADGGETQTSEHALNLVGRGGGNGRRRKTIKRMRSLFRLVLTVTVVLGNVLGCPCVLNFPVRGGDGGVGLGLGLRAVLVSETSGTN